MTKKRLRLILSISALGCGLLLYVLFREETYIAKLFSGIPFVTEVQNRLSACSNAFFKILFPRFFVGILPLLCVALYLSGKKMDWLDLCSDNCCCRIFVGGNAVLGYSFGDG